MEARDAWLYAATWGSYITGGDPGACMYGFSEDCRPQSEDHRQRVIAWVESDCRPCVIQRPDDYDEDELEQLDEFLEYIKQAELRPA